MSMWSAAHSGQMSVICTITDTWLLPVMQRPWNGGVSTHFTWKHCLHAQHQSKILSARLLAVYAE